LSMMLIDPKLLEQMEKSTCFGIAHDSTAKECKMCDVQQECAARTASGSVFDPLKQLKPETQQAMNALEAKKKPEPAAEKTKAEKAKKEPAAQPSGVPDMKGMSLDALWALLKERGGTCKEYDNANIQKMRLIMAIKATYK
jgi:hypothetical protein